MVKSKLFVRAQHFSGEPKESDFQLIEQEVDENLCDGEILTEALCISPDPYIRLIPTPIGSEFRAFQVSKVLKSKNADFPEGCMVLQECGWRTITKSKGETIWYRCDEIPAGVPISAPLGALGMPGLTAHYGLNDFIKPKPGETVMVTSAAGAVGTMVGQIAKIMGCRAIGCCGSDAKVEYVKSLGFDAVFNYKTQDWEEALKEAAPNGIDCFYDNVGGKISSAIIEQMNSGGRIGVCGYISAYNELETPQAPVLQGLFVSKCLKMEGFLIFNHPNKKATYDILKGWIAQGKIKTRETVTNGFDNLPKAFVELLKGSSFGKAIVML